MLFKLFRRNACRTDASTDAALAEAKSLLQTIDRAQAVIEFNLDGTIRRANANFLATLGYPLEEIVGRHHAIFVDPDYASSPEYAAFWDTLRQGHVHSGRFRRRAKSGDAVWIEASYNPVFDADGAPYKIVKFATDITAKMREAADFSGQLAAISKAQAVIEFALDGTILTANDNFLSTLGYNLEEILGLHHSMFVDRIERQGDAYRRFWAALGEGRYDAGRYRRIAKGGRAVWIQASYNPIFDGDGNPWKVVKYATDITDEVLREHALANVVSSVADVVSAARAGDLRQPVPSTGQSGAIGELSTGVNALIDCMEDVVRDVSDAAGQVNTAAREIAAANEDLARRTERQAASLEETASSIEEIAVTVRSTADNARRGSALAQAAVQVAEDGGRAVDQVIETMAKIERNAAAIAEIIGVIDGIAFQTNILALNAAVEAARAGDQGRGFGVVAHEVRALAQRCATASKDIRTLITASGDTVRTGARLAGDAGETMTRAVGQVRDVTGLMGDIAIAASEQSAGIGVVNSAIGAIDESTQQNAALVEEVMASTQSLANEANALVSQVGHYRTTPVATPPRAAETAIA